MCYSRADKKNSDGETDIKRLTDLFLQAYFVNVFEVQKLKYIS
jgi:hypothetical protein